MTVIYAFAVETEFWHPHAVGVVLDEDGDVIYTPLVTDLKSAKADLGFMVPLTSKGKEVRSEIAKHLTKKGKTEAYGYCWVDDPSSHDVCTKFLKEQSWMEK